MGSRLLADMGGPVAGACQGYANTDRADAGYGIG